MKSNRRLKKIILEQKTLTNLSPSILQLLYPSTRSGDTVPINKATVGLPLPFGVFSKFVPDWTSSWSHLNVHLKRLEVVVLSQILCNSLGCLDTSNLFLSHVKIIERFVEDCFTFELSTCTRKWLTIDPVTVSFTPDTRSHRDTWCTVVTRDTI